MYRRNKRLIVLAVVFVAILVLAFFLINSVDNDHVGNNRIEFVSGKNVSVDKNNNLSLNMRSFRNVNDEQFFETTFKNNSAMTSKTHVAMDYNNKYFTATYDSEFSIEPGDSTTYRFSIKMIKQPPSNVKCNVFLRMSTEYQK